MQHAATDKHTYLPHIVLITLDCVRPDFLGCYGCREVRTPRIDRMAARGAVFEQAITQAPNTWTGHAGIMTGLYPPQHGLRSPYDRILPEIPTLASMLKAMGYQTAGFPGNDLAGTRMGFGAGFDLFFEQYRQTKAPVPDGGAILLGADHPSIKETRQISANIRNAWEDVLRAAESWLGENKGPVFLWFHYLDTHHLPALDLPENFRFSRDPHWQFYEGKISWADERCVGAVLDILRRHGLYEDSLLILISDHGEDLAPGSAPRHNGDLTDPVLRVPLILFGERMPWKGLRIPSLVRTVDLVPTLAVLLDAPDAQGSTPVCGVPLPLPGLKSKKGDRSIFCSVFSPVSPQQKIDLSPFSAYAENEPLGIFCLRTGEWKYVEGGKGQGLFHLPSDPGERANVIREHQETAGILRQGLRRIRSLGTARSAPADREEQETRRILQALGYMS